MNELIDIIDRICRACPPPEFIREELKALADGSGGMLADMFK